MPVSKSAIPLQSCPPSLFFLRLSTPRSASSRSKPQLLGLPSTLNCIHTNFLRNYTLLKHSRRTCFRLTFPLCTCDSLTPRHLRFSPTTLILLYLQGRVFNVKCLGLNNRPNLKFCIINLSISSIIYSKVRVAPGVWQVFFPRSLVRSGM